MSSLSIGTSSTMPLPRSSSIGNDVPPMHDAVFESPEVAIAHEQATFASHGMAVSKEYATYMCSFGLANTPGVPALTPDEWESANSKKLTSTKSTTVDNNLLLNAFKSNLDNLITKPSLSMASASLNQSKLDSLYNQLYL